LKIVYVNKTMKWNQLRENFSKIFSSIYRVSETTRTALLSRKQSILEKNVSDKSYGVLNDPFNDLISLTNDGVIKVRAMSLKFLNRIPYFSLHILVSHLESFPKHYNKIFFH